MRNSSMESALTIIKDHKDLYYDFTEGRSTGELDIMFDAALLELKKTSLKKLLSVVKNEKVICTGTWGQANAATGCLFAAGMPKKYWKEQEKKIEIEWQDMKDDYSYFDDNGKLVGTDDMPSFKEWMDDWETDESIDIVNYFGDDNYVIMNVISIYDEWAKSYSKMARVEGFTLNGEKGTAKFSVKALNARGRARLALKIQKALNAK